MCVLFMDAEPVSDLIVMMHHFEVPLEAGWHSKLIYLKFTSLIHIQSLGLQSPIRASCLEVVSAAFMIHIMLK